MKAKHIVLGLGFVVASMTIGTASVSASPGLIIESQAMYRLYNANSGEHFYTKDTNEKASLVRLGWKDEGIGWYAPSAGSDVYRLYNPNTGDHHYTLNPAEKAMLVTLGWKYEGVGWQSDVNQAVPLYRVYNPYKRGAGSHNYTTNTAEVANLVRIGWKDEGIGWYGVNH